MYALCTWRRAGGTQARARAPRAAVLPEVVSTPTSSLNARRALTIQVHHMSLAEHFGSRRTAARQTLARKPPPSPCPLHGLTGKDPLHPVDLGEKTKLMSEGAGERRIPDWALTAPLIAKARRNGSCRGFPFNCSLTVRAAVDRIGREVVRDVWGGAGVRRLTCTESHLQPFKRQRAAKGTRCFVLFAVRVRAASSE